MSNNEKTEIVSNVILNQIGKNNIKLNENKFDKILNEICEHVKNIDLENKQIKKKLQILHKEYNKEICKSKKKKSSTKPKGISKPSKVPRKISKLLGLKNNEEYPRTIIGSKIHKYIKENNLVCENDKRLFRVNNELSELFDISFKVNEINDINDKNAFTMYNLQSYIKNVYDDNNDFNKTLIEL